MITIQAITLTYMLTKHFYYSLPGSTYAETLDAVHELRESWCLIFVQSTLVVVVVLVKQ